MCHSTGLKEQSEQIDKFVENGMPKKAIKSVNSLMQRKKRDESNNKIKQQQQQEQQQHNTTNTTTTTLTSNAKTTSTIKRELTMSSSATASPSPSAVQALPKISACPFNNGKAFLSNVNTITTKTTLNNSNVAIGKHQQEQLSQDNNQSLLQENIEQLEVYVDALALGTQWTKRLTELLSHKVHQLQSSKVCTVLLQTTQAAHLIAFVVVTSVLVLLGPDLMDTPAMKLSRRMHYDAFDEKLKPKANIFAIIFYLGAFATHFGAQIWMTFVSGLSLYFSLPRHTFGQCQQILFPKYFALNAMLSIGMLVVYVKYFFNSWTFADSVQILALALSAIIEVIVRLYLAPPMLRLMVEKYKIEDTVGSGNEVGNLVQGDLVQCPHYQRIHKMFRRIHMTIAILNMAVLMCTCLNLYFLASKIQLS